MNKRLVLVLLVLLPFLRLEAGELKSLKPARFEIPGTQIIPIKDTQANKQYELYIKLPEKYAENKDRQYPVIYFTDAVWHMELLSSATYFMMEEAILVGISWQKDIGEDLKQEYGEYFSRFGDYSFKKTSNPKHPKIKFGQAKNHLAFIRHDVFKYVEENYRTEPDNRTYFGFSAGGLFGTYALMAQPDTFKNYMLGSPSIWSNAPELFALEHTQLKSDASAINLFITYGDLEKELAPHIEDFVKTLKSKNYAGLSSIRLQVIESAGHSDSFPEVGIRSVKWLSSLQSKKTK